MLDEGVDLYDEHMKGMFDKTGGEAVETNRKRIVADIEMDEGLYPSKKVTREQLEAMDDSSSGNEYDDESGEEEGEEEVGLDASYGPEDSSSSEEETAFKGTTDALFDDNDKTID